MSKLTGKLIVSGVLAATLASTGCENAHQDNMKEAQARWARARASVMMQLAEQQYAAGEMDKALTTLGKAIEMDPKFAGLQVLRGQVLAEKGQSQAAMDAFVLALSLEPDHAEAHYQAGIQLERCGQFAKALEHYLAARRARPANVPYAIAAAETLGQLSRVAEALELIDSACRVQEQSVALRVTAGELCMGHRNYEGAARYLRDAVRYATNDPAIVHSLAIALYRAGHHEEAQGYLEQLLSALSARGDQPPGNDPAGRAELLTALGECYLSGEMTAKAEDCFREVAALCPDQGGAWESLGKLAMHQGRWAEALAAADKAIALAPRSPAAHLMRGFALGKLSRPAEAIEALQAARRLAPGDVLTLCLISGRYQELGDLQAARETLVRALQIAPTDRLATRMMTELALPAAGKVTRAQ